VKHELGKAFNSDAAARVTCISPNLPIFRLERAIHRKGHATGPCSRF
jgi:hypothetical protein